MKVSKGLGFPVVALPGVGHMPGKGEDEQEAARLFYVAATRATHRLVITVSGTAGFGKKLDDQSFGPVQQPPPINKLLHFAFETAVQCGAPI